VKSVVLASAERKRLVRKRIKCDSCGEPATNHLTRVEKGGQRREVHLCEACAEKQNVLHKQDPQQKLELNLSSFLQVLIGQQVGAWSEELSRKTCPICGIKFMEFRSEGRLGCPHDYEVFRSGLEPLLVRIHRATHHKGKRPKRGGDRALHYRDLLELRQQLKDAVDCEEYERAAKLRDLIRQKECLE
jgi:protein arginine kinase activator